MTKAHPPMLSKLPAFHRQSPHCDARPTNTKPDTVVIHAMYSPKNPKPLDLVGCIEQLEQCSVSAHWIIDRRGKIASCVLPSDRAWHAGASEMPFTDDRREKVNDFSFGVELLGFWDHNKPFTASQYRALVALLTALSREWPLKNVVGHSDISPGRKFDPGQGFDWNLLKEKSIEAGLSLRFPSA